MRMKNLCICFNVIILNIYEMSDKKIASPKTVGLSISSSLFHSYIT